MDWTGVRTVFLDRDGVINAKPPEGRYVTRLEEFHLLLRAPEALAILAARGIRLIVTTNQRGVARGLVEPAFLEELHASLGRALAAAGAPLAAVYVCPHEAAACSCRKPDVGLFLRAQQDFPDIRFEDSIAIGDSVTDLEAAQRLGARKVLIRRPDADVLAQAKARGISVDGAFDSLWDAAQDLHTQAKRS